jgi:hypothetical protein
LIARVVADTEVDHVVVAGSHTNMTSKAVNALVLAPFFGLIVAVAFEAWPTSSALTLVTGIIANSSGEIIHGLVHLWITILDKHFVVIRLVTVTVAIHAVHASVTALLPLLSTAGFWVLDAGFAVVFTPSEVALSKAWGSGNVAFDAVGASLLTLFHVAGVWATFISAVSARHAVLFAPSEVTGFHAWVEGSVALKAWFAFTALLWAVSTV